MAKICVRKCLPTDCVQPTVANCIKLLVSLFLQYKMNENVRMRGSRRRRPSRRRGVDDNKAFSLRLVVNPLILCFSENGLVSNTYVSVPGHFEETERTES